MAEMPLAASPAWESWRDLSARLPAQLDLDELAHATEAICRHRPNGVSDGTTLLRLALARGPGGMSLQQTAAWARLTGVAELTAQSLNERLHQSVGFLAAILHGLLTECPVGRAPLWSGRCLKVSDGSSLSQPGSKGTDWRLHGVYDLGSGGFSHIEITDQRGAESVLRGQPVGNEIRIADRGYAKARDLRAWLDQAAATCTDFIVRVGWKALALRDTAGKPFSLIGKLHDFPAGTAVQEWRVEAEAGSKRQPHSLPLRLIAVPLPVDKVAAAQLKLKRTASKHQDRLDPRSLLAAGFMVLATSLPAETPAEDIGAVYRLRWQIELAFKRMKSLLHIDRLPTKTAAGSLCWLYAHLILLLLTEDVCRNVLDSSPSGPCRDRPMLALADVQARARCARRRSHRACPAQHPAR